MKKSIQMLLPALLLIVTSAMAQNPRLNNYITTCCSIPNRVNPGKVSGTTEERTEMTETNEPVLCKYQNWHQVTDFTDIVQLMPVRDVVYPGAIIQSVDIDRGNPASIPLARTDGTITVSGIVLSDNRPVSRHVDVVSNETIEAAINDIIYGGPIRSTIAQMAVSVEEVYNVEHALATLGVSAGFGGASIRTQFNSFDFKSKTNIIAKVTQTFYSVSFGRQLTSGSGELFARGVTKKQIEPYVEPYNPPAMITEINYGRILLFTFSVDRTESGAKQKIDAAFNGFGADVSADFTNEQKTLLAKTEMRLLGLGGNSEQLDVFFGTGNTDKIEAIKSYIRNGSSFSAKNPGTPIGYKAVYLQNWRPLSVNSVLDFQIPSCEDITFKKPLVVYNTRLEIRDTADDDEDMHFGYRIQFFDRSGTAIHEMKNSRPETYVEEPGKVGMRDGKNVFFTDETYSAPEAITKLVLTVSAGTDDGDGSRWGSESYEINFPFNDNYSYSPFGGRMIFKFKTR